MAHGLWRMVKGDTRSGGLLVPRFTDLRVWQAAHGLALEVYRCTTDFPQSEIYGLTSQLRRAATSVGANIAEGQRRRSPREFSSFLSIAEGSLAEVQNFLMVARDLNLLTPAVYEPLERQAEEVERMLVAFQRTLQQPQKVQPSAR